jgi:hypothetical protein
MCLLRLWPSSPGPTTKFWQQRRPILSRTANLGSRSKAVLNFKATLQQDPETWGFSQRRFCKTVHRDLPSLSLALYLAHSCRAPFISPPGPPEGTVICAFTNSVHFNYILLPLRRLMSIGWAGSCVLSRNTGHERALFFVSLNISLNCSQFPPTHGRCITDGQWIFAFSRCSVTHLHCFFSSTTDSSCRLTRTREYFAFFKSSMVSHWSAGTAAILVWTPPTYPLQTWASHDMFNMVWSLLQFNTFVQKSVFW